MLSEMYRWCHQWRMKINREKTQIIHFRHKKMKQTLYNFYLGDNVIQIVNEYRYLGCTLSEHLNFKSIGNHLAEGAGRAFGKLIGKHFQNKGLGYRTYTKLYDSCVVPLMDVFGDMKGTKILIIFITEHYVHF